MKNKIYYFILERGHTYSENTLHRCSSIKEREEKTHELIYGDKNLDGEGWDKYLEELLDSDSISFEGDPGIEWFTAMEAAKP